MNEGLTDTPSHTCLLLSLLQTKGSQPPKQKPLRLGFTKDNELFVVSARRALLSWCDAQTVTAEASRDGTLLSVTSCATLGCSGCSSGVGGCDVWAWEGVVG